MRATPKACFAVFVVSVAVLLGTARSSAASLMENLGRGVVAVRASNTEMFVSWRLLGTDPTDIAFNLYRSADSGPATLLNATPITGATHFTDTTANFAQTNAYHVRPLLFGTEQAASASFTVAASAPVQQYLRVALQRPANGVTPTGETYTYSPNDMSAGDVDGDGEYDLFVKWEPSNAKDSSQDGYTGNTYIDVYKMDGTRLWRIDLGVNIRAGAHDTPFIVYDFDGDGRAEVAMRTAAGTKDGAGNYVADPAKFHGTFPSEAFSHTADYRNPAGRALVGPEFLTVFNGLTGVETASTKFLPARHPDTDFPTSAQMQSIWGDTSGNRQGRFYPPGVAYLDGQRPSIVMGRGYASGQNGHPGRVGVAAWNWRDGQLTHQWLYETSGGGGAHNAAVADLNGDGLDDIVYGQVWLRHDGTLIERQSWGHGDALHISNMDPDRPGQQVFMPHESPVAYGPNALSYEDGPTAQLLFGVESAGDIGRGAAADIDPRFRGFELWGSGGGGLYNVKSFVPNATLGPRGVAVATARPNAINFVISWDGDTLRELLDNVTISKWNWTTESQNALLAPTGIASNNGTKATPNLQADLFGDWREEVIWRETNNDFIRIYTTTIPTTNRFYTLMHDRQYREAIAWQNVGYNQPPHPSYFMGNDMATPPMPNIVTSLSTLLGPPAPVFTGITNDTGAAANDFITSDTTLVLHGTATPNTTVTLTRSGVGVIGSTPVDAAGQWSFDYSGTTLPSGVATFTAAATDAANNTGAPSAPVQIVIDIAAPAAPVITSISSGSTLQFSGSAEAGSTVTVLRAGFGPVGSATANSSGQWTLGYSGPDLPPGEQTFTAQATDTAGNSSADSAPVTIDPAVDPPAITSVTDDTGSFTNDGITVDGTLVFGGSAGAGNLVTLSRAGIGDVGSATAGADGQWTIDYTGTSLADGNYTFSARASAGGASSAASPAFVVLVDTSVPAVLSVNRSAPSAAISASSTITFRAAFNEPVASVTAADFTATYSGGLSGSIDNVVASGATSYDVTLSLTGEGSVRLDVNAGGISDLAGNTLAAPFTAGQPFTRSLTGDGVWIRSESGGLWSANTNWQNGIIASGAGTIANFNTLEIDDITLVQLDSPRTIGNLIFGDTDILSAASWVIDDQGAAANTLTLATAGGTPTITVNALGVNATSQIMAGIAGTQGLNKQGPGTLALDGPNSLTGAVAVTGGALLLGPGSTTNLGNSAVSLAASTRMAVSGGAFATTGQVQATSGLFVVDGGAAAIGNFRTNSDFGSTLRVNGGSLSVGDVNIRRNSAASPDYTSGFIVTGGTATATTVQLGSSNSNGALSVQGGALTVTGTITIGNNANSGRGGALRVIGGQFTSTDTTSGIILTRASGNATVATFSGGASTVEKFTFGFDAAVVAGSGTLTVNGGTLYLGSGGFVRNAGSTGTYNAVINLASGTLGAKADWATDLPVTLATGGNISIQAADAAGEPRSVTLNGVLAGSGGLTKTGAGTLILGAQNTYTGATVIAGGGLRIPGRVVGPVVLNDTGSLLLAATTLELGASGLTWSGGGSIALDLGASGTSGRVNVAGPLTKAGPGLFTFVLNPGEGFAAGNVYTLATFSSTNFTAADFVATGLPAGFAGAFTVNDTSLQLTIVGTPFITSAASASGIYGAPFNYSITAGNVATSFGAVGLPSGLSVDPDTGVISGAPLQTGIFNATLNATNLAGTDTAPLALTIVKATATITFGDLSQPYDGAPKPVTATTSPAGIPVSVLYEGSAVPPTLPGLYDVDAVIVSENYEGSASGTLAITITALVRHAPVLNGGVDGSLQVLLPENVTLNSSAAVSGDLLVPGKPGVVLNGSPVYGSTLDSTGSATPTSHTVTLNSRAVLSHVVRRVDPLNMPVVPAPQAPAGTRNVTLNSASQSLGNFSTLRNLTLNSQAGNVAVPAGAYGTFTANGNSAFVLGVPGGSEPAEYHLQSLTLNTGAKLQIVGPVRLRLAASMTVNAGSAGSAEHPEWLELQVANGGLTLNTGAAFRGNITAPNGTILLNSNCSITGRLIADGFTLNGGNSALSEP
jgi:autotransporter-associated beta strand protein